MFRQNQHRLVDVSLWQRDELIPRYKAFGIAFYFVESATSNDIVIRRWRNLRPSFFPLKGIQLRSHCHTPLWDLGSYGVVGRFGLKVICGSGCGKGFLFGNTRFGTSFYRMSRERGDWIFKCRGSGILESRVHRRNCV
jgi:hypothetical protein